jgi:hypothetical protein
MVTPQFNDLSNQFCTARLEAVQIDSHVIARRVASWFACQQIA